MAVYRLPQPPAANTVWIIESGQVEEWMRDRAAETAPDRPLYRGESGVNLRWLDLFDRGNGEVFDERPPSRGEALDRLQHDLDNASGHTVAHLLLEYLAQWGADGFDVKAAAEQALDREAGEL